MEALKNGWILHKNTIRMKYTKQTKTDRDYTACMDHVDLPVHCSIKAIKLNHPSTNNKHACLFHWTYFTFASVMSCVGRFLGLYLKNISNLSVEDYSYVGCYSDPAGRLLSKLHWGVNQVLTIGSCVYRCKQNNYDFAGLKVWPWSTLIKHRSDAKM